MRDSSRRSDIVPRGRRVSLQSLQARLRDLGFTEVEIVDEDLGRSAAGTGRAPVFGFSHHWNVGWEGAADPHLFGLTST
jgi:hypothetical protein